jgi:HK97 family phage portal protein
MHIPLIPLARGPAPQAAGGAPFIGPPQDLAPKALGSEWFENWKDPRLAVFFENSGRTHSGANVTVKTALRNTAVFRCVSLISYAIGMLPLHLLRGDDFESEKANDHPLYDVLYSEPNDWQSAFDFRSHMQLWALTEGDAYARVVRSGTRIKALVPMNDYQVTPKQNDDWTVSYEAKKPNGGQILLSPRDVFHLRGLSMDGVRGLSLVKQAAEAIGLAIRTEEAAARLFKNGMLVGGVLSHPGKLGPEGIKNLRDSLEERYASTENAHKWMVFEEGMKAEKFAATAAESQHIETRKHQIEEIARIFGVPRPLMGVDDTSWGSGIEQLGIGFVRYALAPWFTAWEQAIRRTLLVGQEKADLKPKFNEGALLRGSMKEQGEFFARALGSGGHQPWMHVDEVRALQNLRSRDDLAPPATAAKPPTQEAPPDPMAAIATAFASMPQPVVNVTYGKKPTEVTEVTRVDAKGNIKEFVRREVEE